MFITCRKKVKFTHPDNPAVVWEMKPGFIGDVPEWVVKHWYFDALCKDGGVSKILSKKDKDIQDAVEGKGADAEKAAAEAAKAAKQAEDDKKRLIDEAKAKAKSAAEDEAKANGLDAAATKKLIAEKQKTAVEVVNAADEGSK